MKLEAENIWFLLGGGQLGFIFLAFLVGKRRSFYSSSGLHSVFTSHLHILLSKHDLDTSWILANIQSANIFFLGRQSKHVWTKALFFPLNRSENIPSVLRYVSSPRLFPARDTIRLWNSTLRFVILSHPYQPHCLLFAFTQSPFKLLG